MRILKCLMASLVLTLASCGVIDGPNFWPRDGLYFEAPNNDDAVRKVGPIVETEGLSPAPLMPNPNLKSGLHPLELVAIWKWPNRPAFSVSVMRKMPPDEGYIVAIEDSTTGGFIFVGPGCQKYLEIAAALKAQSRIGSFHAGGENCDMRRKTSN